LVTETINQSFPLTAGSRTMSGMLCQQKGVGKHSNIAIFKLHTRFESKPEKGVGTSFPRVPAPLHP